MSVWTDLPHVRNAMVVDTYREGAEVLASDACNAGTFDSESAPFMADTVSEVNGDLHQIHRRIVAPLFGRNGVRSYEFDVVGSVVATTLDRLRGETDPYAYGFADLVELSGLMILQVAAHFIGLDGTDDPAALGRLLADTDAMGQVTAVRWSRRDHARVIKEGEKAREAFVLEFYQPSVARRRQTLNAGEKVTEDRPDLLTLLMSNAEWTDEVVLREVITYLTAGVRTTAHTVTRTFEEIEGWLQIHPERAADAYGPNALRRACNETLRLHPSSPALTREAVQAFALSGGRQVIPGTRLAVNLLACNTDPQVFGTNAGEFDPERTLPERIPPYGVSFGAGTHVCAGRPLVTAATPIDENDVMGLHRLVVRILSGLKAAGMELDPDRRPQRAVTEQDRYVSFPVRFEELWSEREGNADE